jgi:hypothetical protein
MQEMLNVLSAQRAGDVFSLMLKLRNIVDATEAGRQMMAREDLKKELAKELEEKARPKDKDAETPKANGAGKSEAAPADTKSEPPSAKTPIAEAAAQVNH